VIHWHGPDKKVSDPLILTGAFEMGDLFDSSPFFRDAQDKIRPHLYSLQAIDTYSL
jgi:hypothetical protein